LQRGARSGGQGRTMLLWRGDSVKDDHQKKRTVAVKTEANGIARIKNLGQVGEGRIVVLSVCNPG